MKLKSQGFTLPEMMISMTILSLIIVMVSPMLDISLKGIVTYEVHNALKIANQTAMNRLGHTLTESYRMFQQGRDPLDTDPALPAYVPGESPGSEYLQRCVAHLGQPQWLPIHATPPPPAAAVVLAGSRLSKRQTIDTLSPTHDEFRHDFVGNMLFFASLRSPVEIDALPGVLNINARINVYQFNIYYLANDSIKRINNKPQRTLWEWHSVKYLDYNNLTQVLNGVTGDEDDVNKELIAREYKFAWNPREDNPLLAFYDVKPNGTLPLAPNHDIRRQFGAEMYKIPTSGVISSFRYGVAPNTDAESFVLRHSIPQFSDQWDMEHLPNPPLIPFQVTAPEQEFPYGFEVVMMGPPNHRQVYVRSILVAEGNFDGFRANDQVVLIAIRDSW